MPPGDLLACLLGAAGLSSSGVNGSPASEPRPSTQTVPGQSAKAAAGSTATFVAPEGPSYRVVETERPSADGAVGRSSWTAGEPFAELDLTAGLGDDPFHPLGDDPLHPLGNSRSGPRDFSQAVGDSGSAQYLAESAPQPDFRASGTPGTPTGSGAISSASGPGVRDRASPLFMPLLQVSDGAGGQHLLSREADPGPTGAIRGRSTAPPAESTTRGTVSGPEAGFGVLGTYPASNGLGYPASWPVFVLFNQPVDASTVNLATFAVYGRASGWTWGSYHVLWDGYLVAFLPGRPFMPGEAVDVYLTHDLAAAAGMPLRTAGYGWTFWVQAGAGGGNEFVEASRLDTGTGVRTYGGAATDLNFDGRVDLAVVNEVAADLRVFMNNGDGTFGPLTSYAIRRGASPTVWGDFNRDGLTDIASSNYDDNSMSVVLGNGDGTFRESQTYTTGTTPAGIASFDVNGDAFVELVVVNAASNTLSLFRNNGDGTFQPQVSIFNVPGARLYGLAAADMNNDGLMDLVVGAQTTRRVYVLLNDGAGNFLQSAVQDAAGGPWVLRAADVNGDGYADVQVANQNVGNMAILLGDGAGGLATPVTYAAGSGSISVSLGDLNGDGSLDVVISNFQSRNYAVFTNNGTGGFTRTATLPARQAGSCAIILDYNGDGLLDIGGVDELEDEIILYRNNG